MIEWRSARGQFIAALLTASAISIGFFLYGAWRNQSLGYSYLVWNLFLAWLPLVFAVRLVSVLKRKLWSSWEGIGWSLLWLLFLPNSFYMISDYIHLQEVRRVDLLFDSVMFTSFISTGVALGFSSLYLVHIELRKRLAARTAAVWIALTLLLCSAAVYIGRDLRWNSWDILTNPGGLLFDLSDRLQHPSNYPQMTVTIATFFILLVSMYNLLWKTVHLIRTAPSIKKLDTDL